MSSIVDTEKILKGKGASGAKTGGGLKLSGSGSARTGKKAESKTKSTWDPIAENYGAAKGGVGKEINIEGMAPKYNPYNVPAASPGYNPYDIEDNSIDENKEDVKGNIAKGNVGKEIERPIPSEEGIPKANIEFVPYGVPEAYTGYNPSGVPEANARANTEYSQYGVSGTYTRNNPYEAYEEAQAENKEKQAANQKAQEDAQKASEDAAAFTSAMLQKQDFSEYAQAGETVAAEWEDPTSYFYINNIGGYRDKAKNQKSSDIINDIALALNPDMESGADAAAATEHIYNKDFATYTLTDDERSVYNYIAAKYGESSATEYLSLLQQDLNQRTVDDNDQLREMLDDGSAAGDIIGSALSVPMNMMSAAEGFGVLFGGMLGKDLAVNDPRLSNSRLATGIRNDVASEMSAVGSFFYQTGMSMVDTVVRLPMGNVGLLIAGGSAAAQTADQAMQNGASSKQALILAGISGILEIATEKIGLSNLYKAKLAGNLTGVLKSALISGGFEASEEIFSEIGNIVANIFVMKDESDWNKAIIGYMAQGKTREEATQLAITDAIMQVGEAGLGGFLSGFLFGGGEQLYGNYTLGSQSGKKGADAFRAGFKYSAAINAYENAMQTTPFRTSKERIAITKDIMNSGMSDENKNGVIQLIDAYAMQPEAWLTEKGQKYVQLAIDATRSAAEKNYIANGKLQERRTQSLSRLNRMFTDIQTAYQESQKALESGDVEAHTKAINKVNRAIADYNEAYANAQAKTATLNAEAEVAKRQADDAIMPIAKQLIDNIPAEIANQQEIVASYSQNADGTMGQANNSAIVQESKQTRLTNTSDAGNVENNQSKDVMQAMMSPTASRQAAQPGDLMDYMLNGGKTDGAGSSNAGEIAESKGRTAGKNSQRGGRGGRSLYLAGSQTGTRGGVDKTLDGRTTTSQQGTAGNSGAVAEADEGNRGRGGAVGRTRTERTTAVEGREIKPFSQINARKETFTQEKRASALERFVKKRNGEIAEANKTGKNIEPISTGDIGEFKKKVEIKTQQYFDILRGITGRDVFLYTTNCADVVPFGFADGAMSFVLNTPDAPDMMVFHAAHEHAHNMTAVKKAGMKVARGLGKDVMNAYIASRTNDITEKGVYQEELVSDMFGLYMYEVIVGNPAAVDAILDSLNGSDDDKIAMEFEEALLEFERVFVEVLAGKSIEERDLEDAAQENLSDAFGGVDSIMYSPPMIGQTKDGTPIYKSIFPVDMTKEAKRTEILRLITDVWSKKPITLTIAKPGENPRQITARFDPTVIEGEQTDATELMFGQRHGANADRKITLNLAPDVYELAQNSPYESSLPAQKKDTYSHRGVKEYHYFVSDILFEREANGETLQEPVRVVISIKDKGNEQYVYGFSAERIKAPENQTLEQDTPSKLQSTSASEEAVFMPPADISINDIGDEIKPGDVKYSENDVGMQNKNAAPATREESLELELTDPRNVARYRNEIDGVFSGKLPKRDEVLLGMPPKVLQDHRVSNHPLYMTQSTAWKIAYPKDYSIGGRDMGGKHNLGIEVLKQLPEQLANPLAITNNTAKQQKKGHDSIVVWTDWKTSKGWSVIIPITIDIYGVVGLHNSIQTIFDANPSYAKTFRESGVLYTREGKDIIELLKERRQLPMASNDDVFNYIMNPEAEKSNGSNKKDTSLLTERRRQLPTTQQDHVFNYIMNPEAEKSKGNNKNSDLLQAGAPTKSGFNTVRSSVATNNVTELGEKINPDDVKYSENAIEVNDDAFVDKAMQLYKSGVSFMQYINTPNYDPEVGKVLNRLWDAKRNVRILRTASQQFAKGVTPGQYWEQNKDDFDDEKHQVQLQMIGMYLRNNIDMGGKLGDGEGGTLETLMANIGKAPQYHPGRLTMTAPARAFENFAAFRPETGAANIAANYRDGERLRGVYHDYVMNQNASRAAYMKEWHAKIAEAFGSGTMRESNLAQLLGERYCNEDDVRNALYDRKHMLVHAIDGWFIFNHSGNLLAFCDGDTTFYRDPETFGKRTAAKETVKKTTSQKMRERLRTEFTRVDQSVIHVKRSGNNAVVYIPGIKNPVQIQNGKSPDADTAINTANTLKEFYAQSWETQSRVLVENGYRPANYTRNYFPHMWQQELGLNRAIETFVGYELPTPIAGITYAFKPGKPWAAHLVERSGPLTEFDAIRGFNRYVQAASDVIYMTPAVQRLRQFESYLRKNAGTKFDAKTNSTMADWLRKYANGIANKAAEFDRSAESLFGKEAFTVSRLAMSLISRSAVQGNISSSLSQLIAYISALPTLNAKSAAKGTRQAIVQAMLAASNSEKYDGFADRIPFLKARFDTYETILTKQWQRNLRKVDDGLGWLFMAMDRFSTEAVARAKYDELRSKGYTEEKAAQETSAYCVKLFADRSKGMAPVLFNNKTVKPFLQFQLEVLNQMSHFRDIRRLSAAETSDLMERMLDAPNDVDRDAEKLAKRIYASGKSKEWIRKLMYLALLSLYGTFTRWLMGRDQTWNVYGMAKDFVQDAKSEGIPAAAVNAGASALDQLPFSSTLTGGRVPIASGAKKLATVAEDLYTGMTERQWDGLGMDALMAALAFTPGGGQARKTLLGAKALKEGGYYTSGGQLRYPVTNGDLVSALVFGPSAAAPEDYDFTKTLSKSKTATYKELTGKGYDPMAVYDMMLGLGTTNAEKSLTILTTDGDGDDRPDFRGKDVDVIAAVLGLSYDPKTDGSLQSWAKQEAADYKKNAAKDGITAAEQEKINRIDDMLNRLLGVQ